MKLFKRITLYLSSFSPLFMLIIIKEIIEIANGNWSMNVLNATCLIILFIMFLFGFFSLLFTFKAIKNYRGKRVVIKSKQNITDQHFLGYFSLFVLFALTFEIEMYSMAFIFFAILILIGIVYVKNDFYYVNPLVNLLGYSFYDLVIFDGKSERNVRAFMKGMPQVGQKCLIYEKYNNLILLERAD